ncbi:streptomycin 6-kinase [Pseudarthrobacter oxydans]|uniref:aminoglycoside phosphotransferase family protein n=1 Tax=Pseudarthrobacter oxydans TaxID=1671 RepID=UPI00277D42B1|nr:aminoglycoside phosphotransferase family protein [Pseudarthrobacter oxydans]MDP9984444.1 streptomycin 6-kinase [Pseudarthrobacter oxydans]
MTQVALPTAARDRLLDRFGSAAAAWIDDFAALVGELCEEWALEPQSVRAGGTGAVVECVSTRTETRYALKLSPDRAVTEQEAAALAYWTDALTVVDLVDVDATRSAILLEWVPESAELTAGAWGIADVAGLIGDLYLPRRTLPSDVPLARERVEFVFELWDRRRRTLRESPIDATVWRRCREAALDMANEGDSLLHGDLHPGNILRTGTGSRIVAIDPRPCIGPLVLQLRPDHGSLSRPPRRQDRGRHPHAQPGQHPLSFRRTGNSGQ